jgi:hypothetical protein
MSAGQKVPQDAKKEEFRKYLEKAGVLELLTKSLVQLYEVSYNASIQNSSCFQSIIHLELVMLPVDHPFRMHNAFQSIIRSEFIILLVDHLFKIYNASNLSVQNS